MRDIRTYPDAHSLAHAAGEHFMAVAAAAIAARGQFSVALSGGSTPRLLFERLATEELTSQLPWSSVHVFWGDERCVPPDHPDSNYAMARVTLLDRVPIPPPNVHRIRGEMEPPEAAAEYEKTLRLFFVPGQEPEIRTFDLALLGVGTDGHTASLFPDSELLEEQSRWVAAHFADQARGWRITLTPLAINASRHVTFLVAGAGKATILRQVLSGSLQPGSLPAQIIAPKSGDLLWLLDSAAAALL
jgi:6-phosphogluconolactonase